MYNTVAQPLILSAIGLTSKQMVKVELKPGNSGINFFLKTSSSSLVKIPANANYVVNTLRNVVLGIKSERICLVEHLLAAIGLFGLNNLDIFVDGPEIPLGDGSAKLWLDLFYANSLKPVPVVADIELPEPVVFKQNSSYLLALPDSRFSLNYLMDWQHPLIGKRWQEFNDKSLIEDIGLARTFGSLKEHKLLGVDDVMVTLTPDGFSQELIFNDEPVRHKLLDLFGDLMLSGYNPQRFKAKFISVKGGHTLDVKMAGKLLDLLK